MTIPLMMLGPGGDYTTRFAVKGRGLVREAGATLEQQPDTETAGSTASWARRRRGRRRGPGGGDHDAFDQASGSDRFEHVSPEAPGPAYDARGRAPAARGASAPDVSGAVGMTGVALATALIAWLAEQQRSLAALRQAEPMRRKGDRFDAARTLPHVFRVPNTPANNLSANLPVNPSANTSAKEQRHGPESHTPTTTHPHPHPRHSTGARLFADDAGAGRRARRQQGHRLRARGGAYQKRGARARSQQSPLFTG